jgi:hypothetical protein
MSATSFDVGAGRASKRTSVFSGLSIPALFRAVRLGPGPALSADEAATTFYRFFRSKHVLDLKLIAMLAMLFGLTSAILLVMTGFLAILRAYDVEPLILITAHGLIDSLSADAGKLLGICGIVFAWAYQSACTRLGVVDLFASEITTLCRVGTIFDLGRGYIDQYNSKNTSIPESAEYRPAQPSFVSQEEYFPVFNNATRDLQGLEATVVNNITGFYTYMKATRDALRRMAVTAPLASAAAPASATPAAAAAQASPANVDLNVSTLADKAEQDPWHAALCSVIYLLFLAYESGRQAVNDLVEFEPAAAERKVTILLTELQVYSFLLKRFKDEDIRQLRLKLREREYMKEVPTLYRDVMVHGEEDRDWLPAERMAPELGRRYKEAFGEDINDAVRRIDTSRFAVGEKI